MGKINGHDPCPCGSGKKFKICCRIKPVGVFLNRVNIHSEEFFLKIIIEKFDIFRSYYTTERVKLKKNIIWVCQSDSPREKLLPDGINGKSQIENDTGICIIVLRKIPSDIQDAFVVAHELGHLILGHCGYPKLVSIKSYEDIQGILSSMIEDLLVDSKLYEFGFNVKKHYIIEFDRSQKQISDVLKQRPISEVSPKTHHDVVKFTLNYASQILAYNLFFRSDDVKPDFFTFFDKEFPQIAEDAKSLVTTIESMGYANPESTGQLYQIILEKFYLKDKIRIN